jgi:hypothetical protein
VQLSLVQAPVGIAHPQHHPCLVLARLMRRINPALYLSPTASPPSLGSAPLVVTPAMDQPTGPFIYTGFKPTFLLVKNTTQASNWMLVDIARNSYNPTINDLAPNLSDTEPAVTGSASFDLNSNGFKLRGTNLPINANGNTLIYAAFAEVPSFGPTPAKAR